MARNSLCQFWKDSNQKRDEPTDEKVSVLAVNFLAAKPPFDGVYIPSDRICGPFFRLLRQRGGNLDSLKIMLGHYNAETYRSLAPRPAVIDNNLRAIVRHAVPLLADRIQHPELSSLPVGLRVALVLRANP